MGFRAVRTRPRVAQMPGAPAPRVPPPWASCAALVFARRARRAVSAARARAAAATERASARTVRSRPMATAFGARFGSPRAAAPPPSLPRRGARAAPSYSYRKRRPAGCVVFMRLNCSVRRARATAYDYESSRASDPGYFLLAAERFDFLGRVRIRMFDRIWREIIFMLMPQSTAAVTGWMTGSRAPLVGAATRLRCWSVYCAWQRYAGPVLGGGRQWAYSPTLQRMVCPVLGGE